jgi:hypothetical protein
MNKGQDLLSEYFDDLVPIEVVKLIDEFIGIPWLPGKECFNCANFELELENRSYIDQWIYRFLIKKAWQSWRNSTTQIVKNLRQGKWVLTQSHSLFENKTILGKSFDTYDDDIFYLNDTGVYSIKEWFLIRESVSGEVGLIPVKVAFDYTDKVVQITRRIFK